MTSTALLLEVLRPLGWRVDFYLPNRMDEGYGLSADGVENCLKKFPTTLLLAVDCGSTAVETIASLTSSRHGRDCSGSSSGFRSRAGRGCAGESASRVCSLPSSGSSAEPKPPQDGTPNFTELCSAGLAFKLAHALVKRGRETGLARRGGI